MNIGKLLKVFSLLVLLNSSVNPVTAQVSFAIPAISSPIVKTEMLWNLVLISQQPEPIRGNIKLVVKEVNGAIVYSALSTEITLSNGAKTINYSSLMPFSNIYTTMNVKNNLLKIGSYLACYSFIIAAHSNEFISVGDDCIDFVVEPLTPPILNLPDDKSQVMETRPNLNWLPPTPFSLFDNLKYECKLVAINEGQSVIEAIQNNTPVFFTNDLFINNTSIPSSAKALAEGKEYAWQIVAYSGNYSVKSEVWSFGILKDSVREIIERTPYIKMSQSKVEFGTMNQGYIKVILTNNANDSKALLVLTEEGNKKSKPITVVEVNINNGSNFLLKEFRTNKKLDENKIYLITWVNSKNEQWVVRFKPKYYN